MVGSGSRSPLALLPMCVCPPHTWTGIYTHIMWMAIDDGRGRVLACQLISVYHFDCLAVDVRVASIQRSPIYARSPQPGQSI